MIAVKEAMDMEYIHLVLNVASVLFLIIVITKILMCVANYVGEQLGFAKFFIYLWHKIKKNKIELK